MRDVLLEAANDLIRTLLAPACAACHLVLTRPLASPVCADCWRAVSTVTPPWCGRCGNILPLGQPGAASSPGAGLCTRCRRRPPRFDVARSAGVYDGSLRQIVHAFKYGRRRTLATPLARLMVTAGADLLRDADALIPVPLDPWRAMRRGFNQADDLAVALGLPVWRVLRRRRRGPPQAALPAARRHANVRGAFALVRWTSARLPGRDVVLVDDVMTTGATLDACAAALVEAGVRSERALTAARAVAVPRESPLDSPRPSTAPRR